MFAKLQSLLLDLCPSIYWWLWPLTPPSEPVETEFVERDGQYYEQILPPVDASYDKCPGNYE